MKTQILDKIPQKVYYVYRPRSKKYTDNEFLTSISVLITLPWDIKTKGVKKNGKRKI